MAIKLREFGTLDGKPAPEDEAHLNEILGQKFIARYPGEEDDDEPTTAEVKTFDGVDPDAVKAMIQAVPYPRLQAMMTAYAPKMGARMFRIGARVLKFLQATPKEGQDPKEVGYTWRRHVKLLSRMGKDGDPLIQEILTVLGVPMPRAEAKQVQCPDGSEPVWNFTSAPPINMR